MAAFMGCESGEIEVGMLTPASGSSPVSLQQVFSEDIFQQSLLEELLHLPSSSPLSSLPSVSVDSPAAAEGSTSLLRTTPMAVTPSSGGGEIPPLRHHPRPPLPVAPFGRHGGYVHFPSAESDDAMIAQAMLDVISATSSSSLLTPPPPPPQGNRRARGWPWRVGTTAFRAYNAALAPRALLRRQPGAPGQRMIKMGISISRRMHHVLRSSREHDAMAQQQQRGKQDDEAPAAEPSSSQLNHMISERRRRERLNESFEALRGLLPPGSKVM
jgi:hypothetical protein